MKKLSIVILSVLLLVSNSCKKGDDPAPNNNNNNNNHPYYFKFALGGVQYNFNSDLPQYMPFNENEVGGYQIADLSFFPSIGLRLSWPLDHVVSETELMALKGKTIYFDGTFPHPELSFDKAPAEDTWFSVDTGNTNFSVKITNVVFLKTDTSINPLRTYVITGTCNSVMSNGPSTANLEGGTFNFIVSKRDL